MISEQRNTLQENLDRLAWLGWARLRRGLQLLPALVVATCLTLLGCAENPASKPLEEQNHLTVIPPKPRVAKEEIIECTLSPPEDPTEFILLDTSKLFEEQPLESSAPILTGGYGEVYGPVDSQTLDEIPVIADISCWDIAEIVKLIRNTRGIDRRILTIREETPGVIEVQTGEVRGLLDGDGNYIQVERVDGEWKVTSVGIWLS